MAVTKTKFINYIRCPRYVALDKIHKDKLSADVSFKEYQEEEKEELLKEIMSSMYEYDEYGEEIEDLIDIKNEHLETMLPYYKELESIVGSYIKKIFVGQTIYSKDTYNQAKFSFVKENIRYLCYVDILNKNNGVTNIIEVKATTTKKFLNLGFKKNKEFYPLFIECNDGIIRLIEEIDKGFLSNYDEKKYFEQRKHLFNKYNPVGRYIYDIAVQRFIIENDKKETNYSYYLAVLNSEYIFDGTYKDGKPIYNKDSFGNELISIIDVTNITKSMQEMIERDQKLISSYINKCDASKYKLGEYCEYNKKTSNCKFVPVCFKDLLKENSILSFINKRFGFKEDSGIKHEIFDLIEEGYCKIIDIPDSYLNRIENRIQKQVILDNKPYINKEKINKGLSNIEYPIYHLDFETFNCPLPRYKGEKPYQQSVFQFSLHIEREEGICDKNKDHYEFLSTDHNDHREELIKKLIEFIDTSKGTILVYNETFEKTRIKELAELFPEYRKKLLRMKDMLFDLYYLVKTNNKFYQELGYSEEEAKLFNYYHPKLNGSFSIKKVLPVFTDLSYKYLVVSNGMEAIIAYASYDKLSKEDKEKVIQNLKEYCKQDTWAMVEIVKGLREAIVK